MLLLPELPRKYDKTVLRAARMYQRGSGNYPFNPRSLSPQTLLDIDLEFVVDYERYDRGVKWAKDFERRPAAMRD